jgi:tRNA(His) 5'-end guanylyltransferase
MNSVAAVLCQSVQNTALAYVQSDEISLLLIDYRDIKTDAWFDGNLQKIVSVSASIAGAEMTSRSFGLFGELRPAAFDCRAFVLPQDEVNNYFIWRQQDWIRNSIQMLAQSLYSQKELQNKNTGMLHEMCYQKGFNWADQSSHIKNGRVVIQRQVPKEVVNKKTGEKLTVTRNKWYVPEDTPRFFGDDTFINGKVKL